MYSALYIKTSMGVCTRGGVCMYEWTAIANMYTCHLVRCVCSAFWISVNNVIVCASMCAMKLFVF